MKLTSLAPGTAKSCPGFTLIVLLIVVAIVGILVGILLPVLAVARSYARRTQCQANQKQWVIAFGDYAERYEGYIPREGYDRDGEVFLNNWSQILGNPIPGGVGSDRSDSDDVWYNALPKINGTQPASAYAIPAVMRRNFYDRQNVLQCPAARFPEYAYRLNHQFALFSTAMNSQLIQYGEGPTIRYARIEQHRNIASVALFLDNLLEGEWKVDSAQESTHLGQPAAMANRFSARHRRTGNIGFADGHVEYLAGKKVVETRSNAPLKGGPILPPVDVVWELY